MLKLTPELTIQNPDDYKIQRSNRKTICISINNITGSILVKAPYSTSIENIEKFLIKNTVWINKNIYKIQQTPKNKLDLNKDNNVILLFGVHYQLQIKQHITENYELTNRDYDLHENWIANYYTNNNLNTSNKYRLNHLKLINTNSTKSHDYTNNKQQNNQQTTSQLKQQQIEQNELKSNKITHILQNNNIVTILTKYPLKEHYIKANIDTIFHSELETIIDNRLNYCIRHLSLYLNQPLTKKPTVILKKLKGKFGYYKKNTHTICINTLLAQFPLFCIDYILMHELCHIIIDNHSKKFYELLHGIIRNGKDIDKEIKEYSYIINMAFQ